MENKRKAAVRCECAGMTEFQEAMTRRCYHPMFVWMCRKMGVPLRGKVTWKPATPNVPHQARRNSGVAPDAIIGQSGGGS